MHLYPDLEPLFLLNAVVAILSALAVWSAIMVRRTLLILAAMATLISALAMSRAVPLINQAPTPDEAVGRMVQWMGALLLILIAAMAVLILGVRLKPKSRQELDEQRIQDTYELQTPP